MEEDGGEVRNGSGNSIVQASSNFTWMLNKNRSCGNFSKYSSGVIISGRGHLQFMERGEGGEKRIGREEERKED
jgi:hypothetical protein